MLVVDVVAVVVMLVPVLLVVDVVDVLVEQKPHVRSQKPASRHVGQKKESHMSDAPLQTASFLLTE